MPYVFPHWSLWLCLAGFFCLNMLWIAHDPRFALSLSSVLQIGGATVGFGLCLIYRHWRRTTDPVLDALSRGLMIALFAAALTHQLNIFNHLSTSYGFSLVDGQLAAWDAALGFDWNGYVQGVMASGLFRTVLSAAYGPGVGVGLAVISAVALAKRRLDRVEELAFLALGSSIICVLVSILMPAYGAWHMLADAQTRSIAPLSEWMMHSHWLEQLQALRGVDAISLDLTAMEGIVTFPSFHSCLGAIIIWCSRGSWAGVAAGTALGGAILAATPVFGEHYLVDVLAGVAVVAGLAAVWNWAWPWKAEPAL